LVSQAKVLQNQYKNGRTEFDNIIYTNQRSIESTLTSRSDFDNGVLHAYTYYNDEINNAILGQFGDANEANLFNQRMQAFKKGTYINQRI
jgi:hypothetical protein